MKRYGAIFVAALAFAALAWSMATATNVKQDEQYLSRQLAAVKATADYAASLAEIGDRVIDLPNDGQAWHTTVVTHEQPTPRERQLLGWFDREPELIRLKQQTHFHRYTPQSAVYKNVQPAVSNGLPAVIVQDGTGAVVYKVSGDNVPSTSWPLVRGIIDCIRAHCPHCPKPKPKPTPAPEPAPVEPPSDKPVIPDVVGPNDNTPADGRDDTLIVTIGAFLAAVAVGFLATAKSNRSI
ncbi:MAG TPA: hypothetical protein VG125_08430 [Pirellulales bacterium]|jgi:hypothetical protein|nr:hypothetical protein [Pirellulales bacterium]